jgi:hypothetical protein
VIHRREAWKQLFITCLSQSLKIAHSIINIRGWPGLDSRQEQNIFLLASVYRPALGPTQPPIQLVPGALSPVVKRPGRQTDHSPPSSAEAKKEWSYDSTSPYVYIAWCLMSTRDNFTFYLHNYGVIITKLFIPTEMIKWLFLYNLYQCDKKHLIVAFTQDYILQDWEPVQPWYYINQQWKSERPNNSAYSKVKFRTHLRVHTRQL